MLRVSPLKKDAIRECDFLVRDGWLADVARGDISPEGGAKEKGLRVCSFMSVVEAKVGIEEYRLSFLSFTGESVGIEEYRLSAFLSVTGANEANEANRLSGR